MDASLLNANMEHLAALDPPLVLPSLPPLPGGFGPVPSGFQPAAPSIVLQVNAVEDVSLPLAHRLRAMAPPGEPPAAAAGVEREDEGRGAPRGRRQRLLRLTLSDGFTRIAAVEDCRQGCDALRGGVAWGAKLRVAAPLVVRHGVLVLTTKGTELLGGCVAELQAFWERHAVEALARLSGRPQRRVHEEEKGEEIKEGEEGAEERPHENPAGHSNSHIQQYQQSNHHYHYHHHHHQQHHQDIHQQSNLHNHYHHRHHSVPALPIVSARPASPQPLAAWASHQPPTAPFTTTAVIAEVTSELTIREPGSQFSLLVLLAPPSSAGGDEDEDGDDDGIVVDLGHAWLRSALGMDPEAFRALSTSRRPEDIARLSEIVEGVGRTLENFGEGVFVLRLRAVDGVVEAIEARQRHQ